MRQADFLPIRIGHWILRVETAVTAGLAVLNYLEDKTLN
jgi:16S rRNA U1498 N3-methylase RsmE